MIFWYDKYINTNFDNHIIHKETINKIKMLIVDKNIPNIIFYSYYYSCKSILLNYILYMIYGKESINRKTESLIFNIYNNSVSHTITFLRNPNYIIYTFLGKVSYDKYILNELTKLFIENYNIKQYISDQKYRIIIIKNAEYLSMQAQSFLRRIMEKYSHICKFFFLCNQLCPIILPIQSRCLKIRIPNISNKELFESINIVLKAENIYVPNNKISQLLKMTSNNLYESILIIQKSTKNNKIIKFNKIEYSYIKKLYILIDSLFTKKITITFFNGIRDIFYKILILNINDINIIIEIKNIVFEIVDEKVHDKEMLFKVKLDLITTINEIQIQLNNGNKSIFYLELVIVKIFLILQKHKLTK